MVGLYFEAIQEAPKEIANGQPETPIKVSNEDDIFPLLGFRRKLFGRKPAYNV
jgi:hypothetical protein